MPIWNRWSQTAIDCYRRGCVCKGCLLNEITEQKCVMKKSVLELVAQLGAPPEEVKGIFEGLTYQQNNVINAIIDGANTTEEIAQALEYNKGTVQTYLSELYVIAETNGLYFKANCGRLPELVEFLRNKQKEKENEIMYDEDLKLEYANYFDSMVKAIKAGREKLSEIAEAAGIKTSTLSVQIDQFYKRLALLNLVPEQTDKSKRQGVVDFIQSRLLDNNYCEKPQLRPLPEIKQKEESDEYKPMLNEPLTPQEETVKKLILHGLNFDEIAKKLCVALTTVKTHVNNIYQKRDYHSLQDLLVAEFNSENDELRKKITELESKLLVQPKMQAFDFDALKHKIQSDIDRLSVKLKAIETLETELQGV